MFKFFERHTVVYSIFHIVAMIDLVTWPPYNNVDAKCGQMTKLIILAKINKNYAIKSSYCMSFKGLKIFLSSNFLAYADITVFGHTYLFAKLLLMFDYRCFSVL